MIPKNKSFEKNVSSVLDVSNTGDCPKCDLDDYDVGLNTASTISFIVLSLICGISAVGGNAALLAALNRTATFRGRANYYYIVSLALADFFIGLTMTPLYICY